MENDRFPIGMEKYLVTVLRYAYEGNVSVDWDVTTNKIRRWYHVPWLHWGKNGREYVHGLA